MACQKMNASSFVIFFLFNNKLIIDFKYLRVWNVGFKSVDMTG